MADSAGLKHMVMSFRVSELQVLLGYAGRNKSGRKGELVQRALQLVQKGCSMPIQIKIRELYRKRCPPKGIPGQQESSAVNMGPMQPDSASNIPVHPDVKLRRLPFYDIQGELLKPTSLVPRGTSRFQETHFVFHLTPQQAQDIAMSRDFRPGAKCEYNTQVQLRFCLLETSCEQDDNFPPSICVRVNGKTTPLPNPIPTTKPGVEPKRPGRPVDITSQCRLSPTMPNYVDISWASEYPRGYCVAIYLVKKLTSDILLQRLKQFGNRHPDHTRALIKEKLSHDPDSEIATTSLRISLLCPLGKMRITIPCRASTCSHLQCFDASTFLCMNEKKPTWMCPVCDKPAPFHKLMIDGLFVEILRQAAEFNDIQFTEDGTWSPLQQNKETHLISSPSPIIKPSSASSSMSSGSPVSKKPKHDVIDLTLSSSDEEDDGGNRSTPRNIINAGCVSPAVISLDSPTPTHSLISSHDSPLHASLLSSSSSSSSSSNRHSPGFTPTHASNHSMSPVHSSPRSATGSIPPQSPGPSPLSPHPSPLHSRYSPVASTSAFNPVNSIPPPFLPMSVSAASCNPPIIHPTVANPAFPPTGYSPLPMFPSLENEDKDLDEIIKNIVWDYR